MLRAVRFATRLEFEIDPATLEAIMEAAPDLARISPERTRDEFIKILSCPQRVRGFDLLVETGLMESVIPEIYDLQGCDQPERFHPEGDVFVHTRLMLSLLEPEADHELVLSVLLHDIAKPPTRFYGRGGGPDPLQRPRRPRSGNGRGPSCAASASPTAASPASPRRWPGTCSSCTSRTCGSPN